jgi:hypothetical protein
VIVQLTSIGLELSQLSAPPFVGAVAENALFALIVQLRNVTLDPPAKCTPPPYADTVTEDAMFPLIAQLVSVGVAL